MAKEVCKCGLKRDKDYEIQTGKGAPVKLSEMDSLKAKQIKAYDKKQRDINKDLPPPKEGSFLQSTFNRREKR